MPPMGSAYPEKSQQIILPAQGTSKCEEGGKHLSLQGREQSESDRLCISLERKEGTHCRLCAGRGVIIQSLASVSARTREKKSFMGCRRGNQNLKGATFYPFSSVYSTVNKMYSKNVWVIFIFGSVYMVLYGHSDRNIYLKRVTLHCLLPC